MTGLLLRASATLGVLTATGVPALAQISPGPLSRAHEDLEGVTRCLECHELGKAAFDSKCLACHVEIARLRDEGRGLHAVEASQKCDDCHGEHQGKDFEVIHWRDGSEGQFRHERSGWALEGAHAEVACRTCHRSDHPSLQAFARDLDRKPGPRTFLGLETDCSSCHEDPHRGRLGPRCAECHGTHTFTQVMDGSFDHDLTRYPLRGAHASVRCAACHPPGADARLPAFDTCAACHADPHAGRATLAGAVVDCASCHGVDAFSPSTLTVAVHDATDYPLRGKHREVACAPCHRPSDAASRERQLGKAGFLFHPAASRCLDCHDDAHAGQLAPDARECARCHTVQGFSPSTFTVADHEALPYPLRGRHAEAGCRTCHRKGGAGTAGVALRVEADRCVDCHVDPHEGRFAGSKDAAEVRSCRPCHDENAFTPSSVDLTMHDRFEFPLAGAHRAVPCFECHRELAGVRLPSTLAPATLGTPLRFESGRRCLDCHEDVHGGQFRGRPGGGDCAACHGEQSFRPATRFDHDLDARFALEGAHEKVACQKCHPTAARADGTRGVVYRPIIPHRCQDCHADGTPEKKS